MKWFQSVRDRFIDDRKAWWRLWSSWLAVLWGVIVTAVWNSPETLQSIVSILPEETRALLSPLILGLVAGLPILVRLLKQNLPTGDTASKTGQ